MFKSTLLSIITVATGAYAQSMAITSPPNNAFVVIGSSLNITIHSDVPAGTPASNIQLTLCQVSPEPLACNTTAGNITINEVFTPPEQSYIVQIPTSQAAGITQIIAGQVVGSTLFGMTSVQVALGTMA